MLTAVAGGQAFAKAERVPASDGLYWSLTTMTTVGYGDVTQKTTTGKVVAIIVMLVGIGFVAVLTGAIAQRDGDCKRRARATPQARRARGTARPHRSGIRSTEHVRGGVARGHGCEAGLGSIRFISDVPLPNLGEITATAAGRGVQLVSVFQNLAQVSERWGRDRAETVMANHVARLFGSGIADRPTLDYLGAVLGKEEIEKVSTHPQRLELDLGSRTYSKDFKRLAAPDRVRQAERDTALLVYGHVPPAWISLRPWYRDRGLRAQVSAPAAAALSPVTAEELA